MKETQQWDEDDVLSLISNAVQESINLDYKACDALAKTEGRKNEISKDVSAFANSAGGTIVYGVVENKHIPIHVDVGHDPTDISKEWLEQVINSRIQRRIDGVHINPVVLNKTHPGKVLYVVSIPQSMRAPHMAADKRFYKRFNFESVPMEEYEVRDVANRAEATDLCITPLFATEREQENLIFNAGAEHSEPVEVIFAVENSGNVPAEYFSYRLLVDARLNPVLPERGIERKENFSIGDHHSNTEMVLFMRHWGVPGKMPIWKGLRVKLTDKPLQVTFPKEPSDYFLGWAITAPRMTGKANLYVLRSDGTTVTIVDPEPSSISRVLL